MADAAELKIVLVDQAAGSAAPTPRQAVEQAAAAGAGGGRLHPPPAPGPKAVLNASPPQPLNAGPQPGGQPPPTGKSHPPPKLPGEDPDLIPYAESAGGLGGADALSGLGLSAKAAAEALSLLDTGTKAAAGAVASLAGNDNLGAFTQAAEGAANVLGKIPVVGELLSAGLKTAAGMVQSFGKVVDAFVQRGRQLQDYSADLAVSNARAEVRSVLADMREANELGPTLARLTDSQSRFATDIRSDLLEIKRLLAEVTAHTLDYARQQYQDFKEGFAARSIAFFQTSMATMNAAVGNTQGAADWLKSIDGNMAKAVELMRRREGLDEDKILEEQLKALTRQVPLGPGGWKDPVLAAARARINNPVGVVP